MALLNKRITILRRVADKEQLGHAVPLKKKVAKFGVF
jgi:hypothetical protein